MNKIWQFDWTELDEPIRRGIKKNQPAEKLNKISECLNSPEYPT